MQDIFVRTPTAIVEQQDDRSSQVKQQIIKLRDKFQSNTLDLADLLAEAQDNFHFIKWGHTSLGEFAEQVLDIKERRAYYLIKLSKVSKALNISREALSAVHQSKLNEIFALDPEQYKDDIIRLVDEARNMTVEQLRLAIKRLKGVAVEDEYTWHNFSITRAVKEQVTEPAIEMIKRDCGTFIDKDGQGHDISDGYAFQMMCAYVHSSLEEERIDRMQEYFEHQRESEPSDDSPEAEKDESLDA